MIDRKKVIRTIEYCTEVEFPCRNGACPYWQEGFSPCRWNLMKDALELLKEQEPRVLTLEEVKNDCPDYVYIETITGWFECVIQDAGESDKYCGVFVYGIDEDFRETWKTYGKAWRCWTARPTDKQREDTPWQPMT